MPDPEPGASPRSNWNKFDTFGLVLIALALVGLLILAIDEPLEEMREPRALAARVHHTPRRKARIESLDKDVTPR